MTVVACGVDHGVDLLLKAIYGVIFHFPEDFSVNSSSTAL